MYADCIATSADHEQMVDFVWYWLKGIESVSTRRLKAKQLAYAS
jgi:hypothetical protein